MPIDFERNVHCLLGLLFDAVDMSGALQRIRQAAAERTPCFVSTPNLNFLIGSQSDAAFRDSVTRSDLSVADGMPLVWLARLLGMPIRERVAGSTLFEALRADAARPLSVFFFGGAAGVAERACQRLNAEEQGLCCAGFHYPGFGTLDEMSTDEIIDRINASGADFLVVSLGARKGQAWIERNRSRIVVPVISHLGAVVNFVAGNVRRAPRWMQRTGLEWLWRIKEEPGLWRRYFLDGLALLRLLFGRVLPYAWHLRRRPVGDPLLDLECEQQEGLVMLRLRGACVAQTLTPLRRAIATAVEQHADITLNLAGLDGADSAFVGLMVLLHDHQARIGKGLFVEGTRPHVARVFRWCCAEFVFDSVPDAG